MNKVFSVFACLLLATGCSRTTIVPLVPVSGKVVFDGKPVHKGDVVFVPNAEKGNSFLEFGIGKLAANGTYTARTLNNDGVKPGWYKVMVLATENEPQESPAWVPQWIVPLKYTKPETTDLHIEVVADAPAGAFDLTLSR